MRQPCLIFDLDGTLVDSEAIGLQALIDVLPGLPDTVAQLVARYRGWQLDALLQDISSRTGLVLPPDLVPNYRARVATLFASQLQPMPGVLDMLPRLSSPMCIASGGPISKIRQSLAVTGLARFFGERLYSSYEVGIWKPEPGLFLHAAQQMQAQAADCIVIEDSEVGLRAAHAAGMRALFYNPQQQVLALPMAGEFACMSQLPTLITQITGS